MIQATVWKIGRWLPSKFNSSLNNHVTLKGLDDHKTYYLNVTDDPKHRKVIPLIKEGNIIEFDLLNDKNANPYGRIHLLHKPENGNQLTNPGDKSE